MKYLFSGTVLVVLALAGFTLDAGTPIGDFGSQSASSLFAQSAHEALRRDFSASEISYLLMDARTGNIIASRWEKIENPIPLGSLIKPFIAMAYGERHAFIYPTHFCRGLATGCWLPSGHGHVDLTSAIAYSCNSYFRVLTAELSSSQVSPAAERFGLPPPPYDASGSELMGIGERWLISPVRMARAYLELSRRRDQPGERLVLAGMSLSGRKGTGSEVDRALASPNALVKTGTAPCAHHKKGTGDGFTMVLLPADRPNLLLMVRVHGVPGAHAAKIAGRMLRSIQE